MQDFEGSTYLVYQEEVGDSGTHHLQGYVEFPNKKSLQQVRGILEGAHWEPRAGTAEQAAAYCKKDPRVGGPYEYGTISQQGMPHHMYPHYGCLQALFQLNYCDCTIYMYNKYR